MSYELRKFSTDFRGKKQNSNCWLSLVEPLLGKEPTLWMATSTVYQHWLKKTGIYENCVGPLCLNREVVTKTVKEKKTKESGNYSSAFWSSVCAEKDKKNVMMISTHHGDKQEK
jgi:hypothetical protein